MAEDDRGKPDVVTEFKAEQLQDMLSINKAKFVVDG